MDFDVEAIRDVSDEGNVVVGYALGDTGPAVAEIRARLIRLELLPEDRMGDVFDAEVDQAVRRFQQRRGINVDGTVGPLTFRRLEEARWRLGDRTLSYHPTHMVVGDDVLQLQERLTQLGFSCGRADGWFGRLTDHALREFQLNTGLSTDGVAGPDVFKALARLNRTVAGGDSHRLREEVALESVRTGIASQTIVVDAGHGGLETGYASEGMPTEADLVADIAGRVEGRLGALGANALLSHQASLQQPPPSERERAALANLARANLVISLHIDANPSPEANGIAVYYYGAHSGVHSVAGEAFAEILLDHLTAATGMRDCRTHAKSWDLLRLTRMAAVRVELGYLTNAEDQAKLLEPTFRDRCAAAIVAAATEFLRPVPHI